MEVADGSQNAMRCGFMTASHMQEAEWIQRHVHGAQFAMQP